MEEHFATIEKSLTVEFGAVAPACSFYLLEKAFCMGNVSDDISVEMKAELAESVVSRIQQIL